MFYQYHFLVVFLVLTEVYGKLSVGDTCTIKSSGKSGVCKLLTQCEQAVDDLQRSRFPDICGFSGKQAIICCPKNEKLPRKTGEISKQKCKDYSVYAYRKVRSPVNLITNDTVMINDCGHKVIKLVPEDTTAARKEFPHMALIGYESTIPGEIRWLCGAAIVSENYILTAAHCLSTSTLGDAKWVRVGVTNVNDTSQQQIEVAEIIPHPEYKPSSYYHNIGLIKLKKPIKMNSFARPACLYLKPEMSFGKAIATEWYLNDGQDSLSNHLLKRVIDLIDSESCNASYKNILGRRLQQGILNDIQICGSETKDDTCKISSGGPLQTYHVGDDANCMYDVMGVISFGVPCGARPTVYTRVSHYIKWIEDIVWPQSE